MGGLQLVSILHGIVVCKINFVFYAPSLLVVAGLFLFPMQNFLYFYENVL